MNHPGQGLCGTCGYDHGVISNLVALLMIHDEEEKRLIHVTRRRGWLWPWEWWRHDRLERRILAAMAAATDQEVRVAIDVYAGTHPVLV